MTDYAEFTASQLAEEKERLIREAQQLKTQAEELSARDSSLSATALATRLYKEQSALYQQVQDVSYEIYRRAHAGN